MLRDMLVPVEDCVAVLQIKNFTAFCFLHMVICLIILGTLVEANAENVALPTKRPIKSDAVPGASSQISTKPDLPRIYRAYCPILDMENISAEIIAPIEGGDCGEKSPVRILNVHGIKIAARTVMNCRMAIGFADWLAAVSKLANEILGESLTEIHTGPGYDCRRRNRNPDGKISEHGFANAVDVSGFTTSSGRSITLRDRDLVVSKRPELEAANGGLVAQEETPTEKHRFLKAAHREACARFSTVLGPDSGSSHLNHIHLDMGCHGRDCRYKICQ